jgi:MFS family permease
MRRAAELLVECLRAHGADRIFCVPGESYLELLDALADAPEIDVVVCRHEGGAGFMALADAKITGRPGVVAVSRGPGATNAAIAIHVAGQDAVPLVVLIGATNNLWHPAAIAYLSARYPGNRGYALAIHTLGASLGDTLAPLAAGLLLAWMTWRGAAFVSAVPVIAVAFLLLAVLGREANHNAEAGGGAGLRAYLARVGGLVRDRAVIGLCVMAGFRSMTQSGLLVFIPLYLADVVEVSPVVLGLVMMAMQVGGMIAGPVAGTASDRIGRQPVVFAGITATTLIVAGLTLVSGAALFIVLVSLLGFALFSVRPVIHSWAMDLTPARMHGSAVSLLFGTQSAFSALVPVIGGMIADQWGLVAVFYILAAAMVIANLLVYGLPDVKEQSGEAKE